MGKVATNKAAAHKASHKYSFSDGRFLTAYNRERPLLAESSSISGLR